MAWCRKGHQGIYGGNRKLLKPFRALPLRVPYFVVRRHSLYGLKDALLLFILATYFSGQLNKNPNLPPPMSPLTKGCVPLKRYSSKTFFQS